MFSKPKIKDKQKLLTAIDQAGESLRRILQDNQIRLVYVEDIKSPPMKDYKQQWQDLNIYAWRKTLEVFSKDKPSFTVALYHGDTLCGLVELEDMKRRLFRRRLEINCIEGSPTPHPLKGQIISAFCQVTMDIAKSFNLGHIGVFFPKKKTIPSYLALGFDRTSLGVEKKVASDTVLDLAAYHAERVEI